MSRWKAKTPIEDEGELLRLWEDWDSRAEFMRLDGRLAVTLEDDWSGDTETGFGFEKTVYLDEAQVSYLRHWLTTDNERTRDTEE